MDSLTMAKLASEVIAYTGCVLAFGVGSWGLGLSVFGLAFLTIISVMRTGNYLVLIPSFLACFLTAYYFNLCQSTPERIRKMEMPDSWYSQHHWFVVCLGITILSIHAGLGIGVTSVPLSLMFMITAMQYTQIVNFTTDG
jgi:predicted permease